jgi:hypothetical protein
MKSFFYAIKKVMLALAGGVGGGGFGGLVLLLLMHLRVAFHLELPSLWVMLLTVIPMFGIAGMILPKFFVMFVVVPLTWFSDGGGECSTWSEFFFNTSYLLGLVTFFIGVCFTIPWLVAIGIGGIFFFATGIVRGIPRGF